MRIENSFNVAAPADRVYAFLLEVNNVVRCVPGAELAEVVDPDTFTGRVKIKVGPVTVSYHGTARITDRDAAARTATLRAEGRETTGSGSASATTTMSVGEDGDASMVTLSTEYTVVGRIAQFGRGIMEDVSRQLVAQMAECIRATLEGSADAAAGTAARGGGGSATVGDAGGAEPAPTAMSRERSGGADPAADPAVASENAIDALALGRAVAREQLRKAGSPAIAAAVASLAVVVVLVVLLRRRRG